MTLTPHRLGHSCRRRPARCSARAGHSHGGAPRQPRPAAGQAVYYNLGNPEVKPKRIFTAYSSAAYLDKLKWKHWGTRHAVARGVLISDCASCSPPARRKVTLRLTGFVTCDQDPTLRTYRRAIATVSKPDTGETSTVWKLFAGCP